MTAFPPHVSLPDPRRALAAEISAAVYALACRHIPQAQAYSGVVFTAIPQKERVVMRFFPQALGGLPILPPALVQAARQELRRRVVAPRGTSVPYLVVGYAPQDTPATSGGPETLPAFPERQVVVYGPTGSGKTSVLQHLLAERQGTMVLLDAHYEPGKWPPRSYVVGAGRDFAAVDSAIDALLAEMSRRYKRLAVGDSAFRTLHVAVDELSALSHNLPSAGKRLIDLSQEGRKVKIFTILTPHSTEVEQMGFEGSGDARENYVFIGLDPVLPGQEKERRIVTVHVGNPRRKGNDPLGRFLVPPPQLYQGAPQRGLPDWLGMSHPGQGQSQKRPHLRQDMSQSEEGMSQTLGQGETLSGQPLDTGGQGQIDSTGTEALFEKRVVQGSPLARELAEYLAEHGFSISKIGGFLPYRANDARQTAREAMGRVQPGEKPAAGSQAEIRLVLELDDVYGAPAHRIARLLDGNDLENLKRVRAILDGEISE